MKDRVILRGGFLGTAHPNGCANAETDKDQRVQPITGTILSGDIDGTPGVSSGDCHHVVTFPGGSFDVTLDGLSIRYGYAEDQNDSSIVNGGGVLMGGSGTSDILFDEVRIRDNYAKQKGGGLYAYEANLDLKFCVFRQNHVSQQVPLGKGGGMCLERTGDGGGVNVFSTLFTGNRSFAGGALAILDTLEAGPLVYSCEFRNNNAHRGAAVYVESDPGGLFGNCTVVDNQAFQLKGVPSPASGIGGGFYVNLGGATGLMRIYNSIVWGNTQVVDDISMGPSSIQGPDADYVKVRYSDIEDLLGPCPGRGTSWRIPSSCLR